MDQKILKFARRINSSLSCVYIKHVNNVDVCFVASKVDETHADDPKNPCIAVKGWWMNIAAMKPFIMHFDTIKIKPSDLDSWIEIEKPLKSIHA
jgi:hypothetical protein